MRFLKKIFSKKSRSDSDGIFFGKIQHILGFKPLQIDVYRRAFTHKSLLKTDVNGDAFSYERLEFLGDSVLGTVVSAYLYNEVPKENEGYLTKMRSKIVSRKHLNELGKELNLLSLVDKRPSVSVLSENVHGNVFEALVGAIFLDRGYAYCEQFIHQKIIKTHVDIKKLEGKVISYKSLLIEWGQKEKKKLVFESEELVSGSREVSFVVRLTMEGVLLSKATALSKKAAEEKAATRGYYALQSKIDKKENN